MFFVFVFYLHVFVNVEQLTRLKSDQRKVTSMASTKRKNLHGHISGDPLSDQLRRVNTIEEILGTKRFKDVCSFTIVSASPPGPI
eukprot:GAHX01006111.1.p1 GENE.GAHX01006111.1~~GAHX01006111.1.p1  ORF type:complete len:85 (-),score=1.68 GAHX01006111.1:46-300(-)